MPRILHRAARRVLFAAALSAGLAGPVQGGEGERPETAAARAGPAELWWSLAPIRRPEPPAVRAKDWVLNPIDAFILARLETLGLEPSRPADPESLIRRVTLDLTGLPPSPAEVEAFVADPSDAAYQALVERLLASPRHGERWGRHWLDVARFAESHGFEFDKIRDHAWRYRDYVIASFNADKPYDRFVKEQIAGDALEPVTREGIIATGFLVAGPWDEAGKLQQSAVMRTRAREEELEDVVSAVAQTFLAMTINCARCHDHKFDPIPQRDYYRLKAAFEGIRHGDRSALPPSEAAERAAQAASIEKEIAGLQARLAALEDAGRGRVITRRAGAGARTGLPLPVSRWDFDGDARDAIGGLHGTLEGGAAVAGGRLLLDGKRAFARTEALRSDLREKTLAAVVSLADLEQRGGGVISIEAPDGSLFDAITFGERQARKWAAGSENFARTRDLKALAEAGKAGGLVHVAITYAADGTTACFRNGEPYGEAHSTAGSGAGPRTYARGSARLLIGLRHTGAQNGFLRGAVEEAALYDRALSAAEVKALYLASPAGIAPGEIEEALVDGERREQVELTAALAVENAKLALVPPEPLAYAANAAEPEPTFVYPRGDVEAPGERVAAGGLSAVPSHAGDLGLTPEAREAERRRRLADWIASPSNPLTARVIVNRLWHYHFGRGLAATPNDFGASGERPTHPELLDWLASELIARGWSLKDLHRRFVLSATYRQSSAANARAAAADAESRLLWRFPPRRLEAEAIRDAVLWTSGRLNLAAGGPGFRPFTLFINNSHFYTIEDREGPEYERRTVYRIGVNSAKDPLLEALDCPDPSVKTPARSSTTTPIQALGLMNNSFILRQARSFAERVEREATGGVAEQVALAHRLALGRMPAGAEAERAAALIREHGLETLCWALFNATEFLYLR